MWRTLIEVNTAGSWEPLYPIWSGEPAEPCFVIESNEVFEIRAKTELLQALDPTDLQTVDELNVDMEEEIYSMKLDALSASTNWIDRPDIKSFCAAAIALLERSGINKEESRVIFYKSSSLETR
jgi:hypothetical protein